MEKDSVAMEILKDYKRSNKMKDIIIIILIGIIALFVLGIGYVITQYDFTYTETSVETGEGNAILNGEGTVNAES
jgi:flagellar basal body-associated protein FliL